MAVDSTLRNTGDAGTRRPRVLIVLEYFYHSSLPVGGAERQATKLAQRLMAKGIDVTVVTGQWKLGESRRAIIEQIPVHRNFTFWRMFNIKGLRKFGHYTYLITLLAYLCIHKNNYDLIHSYSAMSNAFVVALAGRLLGRKTLIRPMSSGARWGDIGKMKDGGQLLGTRWMLNRFRDIDCFVALNQEIVRELEAIGIDAGKIVALSNGVETRGLARKTDYRVVSEVNVTFVGRLHPQKGVDMLLPALKKAMSSRPQYSWRLRLVGEGQLGHHLKALACQLGVDHSTEFLGQVQDVFPILSTSDIFVLPSRAEGMSNALLEAMTCGLPCIVTDIPANAEIIKSGENGILVNVDDDDGLAKAMVCLAESQDLRERLGQEAAKTIDNHYSIDKTVEQHIALYQDLLRQ